MLYEVITLDDAHRDLFRGLWEEFEARETPEAKYAAMFDRLEPMYQNYVNEGSTWKENGVTRDMVIAANRHIVITSYSIHYTKLYEFLNRKNTYNVKTT